MRITVLLALLVAALGLGVNASAQVPRPNDNAPAQARATDQADAPDPDDAADGDDAGDDANANPNDVHVHHHHHHYHYTMPANPPYYYSQPNGPANPEHQAYPPPTYGGGLGYGGGYGGGGWGWGGPGVGSTAAGSYLAGAAQLAQGAGQYNLLTAEAARQAEAARAEWLQNQMSSINDWWLARQANREYRKEEQAPALNNEQIYHMEAQRLPRRLRNDQFNTVTGAINWPDILKRPELAAERGQLDQLFASRTVDDSGVGSENYHDVQVAIHAMQTKLHDEIKDLSPAEYLAGITFIDSLAFESRFPPSPALTPVAPPQPQPTAQPPAAQQAAPARFAPPVGRAPRPAPGNKS